MLINKVNTSEIKNEIERSGRYIYTGKGTSMLPLLYPERDIVLVKRKEASVRCKVSDVILFERKNGDCVLHRIVSVDEKEYCVVGDNCTYCERVIDDQILGVMTTFTRKGKTIHTCNIWYRLYSILWCRPWRLKSKILKSIATARKLYRKLVKLIKKVFT